MSRKCQEKLEFAIGGNRQDNREALCLHIRIVPESVEPLNIRFLSKPGDLPLGILPGLQLRGFEGLFQREAAFEDAQRLFISKRFEWLRIPRHSTRKKS